METQVIQSVGFRNTSENGVITGFQLKIRLPYYRGVFLSQLRPGTLIVDGERYEKESVVWHISGEDYTLEEMQNDFQTHWSILEPATLKIAKAGGLTQGYHEITYGFCFTSSYMPPVMQEKLDPDKENEMFMNEFGHHVNNRRLLIV